MLHLIHFEWVCVITTCQLSEAQAFHLSQLPTDACLRLITFHARLWAMAVSLQGLPHHFYLIFTHFISIIFHVVIFYSLIYVLHLFDSFCMKFVLCIR